MEVCEAPRPSVYAGRFYPDDPVALRREVEAFLKLRPERAPAMQGREIAAIMVPHAGYVFSGAIAGMGIGMSSLPDRVIVLGPNHTGKGAPLSLWSGGAWKTPLGEMAIDTRTVKALAGAGAGFTLDLLAHAQEHSLEVLVPFFQVANPRATMAPITVSALPLKSLRSAGEELATVVSLSAAAGERVLLVVSSDMSHFLSHERTLEKDSLALDALETMDPEEFFSVVRDTNISMCGVFPMTMVLFALAVLGVNRTDIVAYATSGQTGRAIGADMDRVVGYAGVLFSR